MINCINMNENNLIINDIIYKLKKHINELKKVETLCKLKNCDIKYSFIFNKYEREYKTTYLHIIYIIKDINTIIKHKYSKININLFNNEIKNNMNKLSIYNDLIFISSLDLNYMIDKLKQKNIFYIKAKNNSIFIYNSKQYLSYILNIYMKDILLII